MSAIPFSISSPNSEIISSGSLVLTKELIPLKFNVADLSFEMLFEGDATGEAKPYVVGDIIENVLKIRVVNFNNTLGTGWKNEIAILNGRKLCLSIFVHSVGSDDNNRIRLLNYTLFLGEVANG